MMGHNRLTKVTIVNFPLKMPYTKLGKIKISQFFKKNPL